MYKFTELAEVHGRKINAPLFLDQQANNFWQRIVSLPDKIQVPDVFNKKGKKTCQRISWVIWTQL